jgi:ribosomal protein L11 methyltransferase
MDWRQFVMNLEELNPDSVEAIFARHGANSISFSDAGAEPVLEPERGTAPLWRDTRISGLFGPDVDLALLRDDLLESLGIDDLPAHFIEDIEDRAWELEWRRNTVPLRFGMRLWVCPGDSVVDEPGAVIVRLDPGLAFGTGTHATTAMCLEWLEAQVLDGATILDFGCGSGVLAIAALRLGCDSACAYDTDPQALAATADNAGRNGVQASLRVTGCARQIGNGYDFVIANILAGPLIELAGSIASRVRSGCLLALSGILSGQVDDVLAAYDPWIAFDDPVIRDQDGQSWARLVGRRIEG